MVSMVLVPYGINPNFDIVPRVMVTSLRFFENLSLINNLFFISFCLDNEKRILRKNKKPEIDLLN
ncbi:hypothetical protein BpHYR1_010951 [Brachionus plicatilis]|uniref:Uncharacterized protein n=1 Tax=Brachionus plicatilis TaxID=10195 RepID=A0A3M7RU82_BRAPC|nr:hypothetical protein BpHYR1_010951 [Brachionus plicatilis]